jgi:peroxiredoxin
MDPHRLQSEWLRTMFPAGPPSPADRSVPPFLLPDHEGWLVSSEEMRAQGPYVLEFFHGSWCADCRARLAMLQSGLHRIHEFGADVIACSPETLEFPRRLKAEEGIRFHIVSDVDCALSIDLGLAYPVSCDTRRHLRGAGIDLEARNGDRRWMLPIPTIMIVNRKGTVAKTFDGNQRIELDEIVDALCERNLAG